MDKQRYMRIELFYMEQSQGHCIMTLIEGFGVVEEFAKNPQDSTKYDHMDIAFVDMAEEEFKRLPDFAGW